MVLYLFAFLFAFVCSHVRRRGRFFSASPRRACGGWLCRAGGAVGLRGEPGTTLGSALGVARVGGLHFTQK